MIPVIVPPTIGYKQDDQPIHSTPKYVLKVPIPQLLNQQVPPFQDNKSGHKENNFSALTFKGADSSDKKVLSHSAKKVNTENEESVVEKSFSEAA